MPAGTPSSHLSVSCPRCPTAWPSRGRTWCPSERGTGSRPAMNRQGITIEEKARHVGKVFPIKYEGRYNYQVTRNAAIQKKRDIPRELWDYQVSGKAFLSSSRERNATKK